MSGCYRDLKVWKKSIELSLEVYRLSQSFPAQEMHGLTNQMRRAAVSIASNIAEGKGRSSDRDFAVFLCHARGSLHELETQAFIASKLDYLQQDAAASLASQLSEIGKMLNGLLSSMRKPERGPQSAMEGVS